MGREEWWAKQTRCESVGPDGFRCGLEKGHDGDHSALIETGAPWLDEKTETPPKKNVYVILERMKGSPDIHGYDLYITPWGSFDSALTAWVECLDIGNPAELRITVMEWTEAEYEAYCEEHEIERYD